MVFANPAQNKFLSIFAIGIIVASFVFLPLVAFAQSDANTTTTIRARITKIDSSVNQLIPGTQTEENVQEIEVSFLLPDGSTNTATLENDYVPLSAGNFVWINRTVADDGSVTYAVLEPDRTGLLIFFAVLFIVVLLAFGGMQGLRGLISLAGGFALIAYVLIPLILKGYSPILISIGVASLITIVGSYITHGFNRTTTSAVLGMIATVFVTGILAWSAVHFGRLSGIDSDEALSLSMDSNGTLNMSGILLGAILIGLLGVLYDVAISQAIAVEELYRANKEMPRKLVFERAMRIGREHIGALVNILALAYVGVSLPLLLMYVQSVSESPLVTINRELFATEILRTLVGSIGIIIAVPITTLVSVAMLHGREFKGAAHGHSHGASH